MLYTCIIFPSKPEEEHLTNLTYWALGIELGRSLHLESIEHLTFHHGGIWRSTCFVFLERHKSKLEWSSKLPTAFSHFLSPLKSSQVIDQHTRSMVLQHSEHVPLHLHHPDRTRLTYLAHHGPGPHATGFGSCPPKLAFSILRPCLQSGPIRRSKSGPNQVQVQSGPSLVCFRGQSANDGIQRRQRDPSL